LGNFYKQTMFNNRPDFPGEYKHTEQLLIKGLQVLITGPI